MKYLISICLFAVSAVFVSCGNGTHKTNLDSIYNPGDTNNINTNRNNGSRNGDQTNSMDTSRKNDSLGRKDTVK